VPVSGKTKALKKVYHHTFEVRKGSSLVTRHTLLLNPQNLTQTEQARTSVTQTLGGAYVTDFGGALPVVSISGTTGYKQRYNADGELRDGYEEFIHFRNEVYRKLIQTNDPDYKMFWYNWEDKEYYQIQPTNFRLQRNVSEPLLYRYEFDFTCLSKASVSTKPTANTYVLNSQLLLTRLKTSLSNISEVVTRL
jgi:hypothetical protein